MSRASIPTARVLPQGRGSLGVLCVATLAGLVLSIPGPLGAASLSVVPEAAAAGSYGLRVGVGSSCSGSNDLAVPDGSVASGTFEGCTSVTANAVEVTGPVTFRAGQRIALGNGFSVASGATFTAEIDGSLPREAFVRDNSPAAETTYSARFSARLDSLSLGGAEEMELFTAYDASGTPQLRVMMRFDAGMSERRLYVEARRDDGSFDSTAGGGEAVVADGWRSVQVDWQAASGVGQNDGSLAVFLDDVAQPGLSGLDNDLASIGFVRWGGIGIEPGTGGSFDLDEFVSFR